MKKVKLVVWMLIVVFVVVVIYQNKDFFWETKKSLTINLPQFLHNTKPCLRWNFSLSLASSLLPVCFWESIF